MKTLWKQHPLDPGFASLNQSLHDDWFLLPFELDLQRAHAHALQQAGILSGSEIAALLEALQAVREAYHGQPCPGGDAEDLHTWIEDQLTQRAGEAGRKIHTARSRNDQVATLIRLFVIEAGRSLAAELTGLIRTLCDRARAWSDVVMPLLTHQQFAAPGTAGFWALRYATGFDRIRRHLDYLVSAWTVHCPLGCGAVGGSSVPIDRRIQATELGFDGPSLNALDATTTRDECLELLAVNAQLAVHVQSFTTDVIIFSQTPQQWVRYPAGFGTGSSMMPNKFNPDAMELLRGGSNAIIAAHMHAAMLLKGLPSGYSRDLQCIKPIVRESAHSSCTSLELLESFVRQMDFDTDRLGAALGLGHIDATLAMEARVMGGTALRDAHHAVAEELRDRPLPSVAAVRESVHSYATTGAASPGETRRVADELLASLK